MTECYLTDDDTNHGYNSTFSDSEEIIIYEDCDDFEFDIPALVTTASISTSSAQYNVDITGGSVLKEFLCASVWEGYPTESCNVICSADVACYGSTFYLTHSSTQIWCDDIYSCGQSVMETAALPTFAPTAAPIPTYAPTEGPTTNTTDPCWFYIYNPQTKEDECITYFPTRAPHTHFPTPSGWKAPRTDFPTRAPMTFSKPTEPPTLEPSYAPTPTNYTARPTRAPQTSSPSSTPTGVPTFTSGFKGVYLYCTGQSSCIHSTMRVNGTSMSTYYQECLGSDSCAFMEIDLMEIEDVKIKCGANGSCADATVTVQQVDVFALNCINNASCTNLRVDLYDVGNATVTCYEFSDDAFDIVYFRMS